MNEDKILDNVLSIIRNYLNEDVPTNNLGTGKIAGTPEEGGGPPVNLKKRNKFLLKGYNIFRRGQSVQPKYNR